VQVCHKYQKQKTIKKIKELRMYIVMGGPAAVQQIKIIKNDFEKKKKKRPSMLGLQVLLVELFDCF
jgi:hypothetical protein